MVWTQVIKSYIFATLLVRLLVPEVIMHFLKFGEQFFLFYTTLDFDNNKCGLITTIF